jgi:hypothetical protein
MDRIYTIHDSDINIFKEHAINNGWLYKYAQTYSDSSYIDPRDNRRHTMTISFRLEENKKYDAYPYLDTLIYYTPKSGRISNIMSQNKKVTVYKLQSTEGNYDTVQ